MSSARSFGPRWDGLRNGLRPTWLGDRALSWIRWVAFAAWAALLVRYCVRDGFPVDRLDLLLWISSGLAATSIGRRSVIAIVLDFLPFAAVLVAYDYLRGISDTLGMPTWWHPQIEADRVLFFGHEPTVVLQEHLKAANVRWYDVVVGLCYFSFFLLPYVTAGVMWWRSRIDFYRWSLRFVGLSFFSFALFALIPAAPPWAAALCTNADVVHHPAFPTCARYAAHVQSNNLLGAFGYHLAGAQPYVERIAGRGFYTLHLGLANTIWSGGFNQFDPVAAFPSLHLGGTMLFSLFMWRRLKRRWRPLLVLYPIVMTFSLVYSGEHYVTDCIGGAVAAVLVDRVALRIERRRGERRRTREQATDILTECQPIPSSPATTPSST